MITSINPENAMGYILSYFIESSILFILLWIVYRWLMSNVNQPIYNRKIILSIYLAAILVPLFVPVISFNKEAVKSVEMTVEQLQLMGVSEYDNMPSGRYIPAMCIGIWVIGMLIAGIATAISAFRIGRIIRSAVHHSNIGRIRVMLTEDETIAPFSVRRHIIMSRSDYDSAGSMILSHECRHIESCHWVDLLVSRVYVVLCWFNPAAWFMIDELRSVHEYEADRAVLVNGADIRQYQLLLIKKAVGKSFPALANSLNHSKLKKRITMMLKSKSAKSRRMRAFALVPAAALAVAVCNMPFMANALDAVGDVSVFESDMSVGKVSENSADKSFALAENSSSSDKVYDVVEVMPEFPGGIEGLMSWLGENIIYPADAPEGYNLKRVIVSFVINKKGKVENVEIKKSGGDVFDKEAIRVVSAMPEWKPGLMDGKPVSVHYMLPINFKEKK
ncbi:MAG: M56 family metallopeptidase [Muribaculaceae bacterium]|nr:M56 family metallopeptidase [Muribaculaceae bacterium]